MIYLDNAATTKMCAEARAAYLQYAENDFGNSSSVHCMGIAAERGLTQARALIAQAIGCETDEIVWTSGGTEADALAVLGAARAARGRHVVVSAIEHPAVLDSARLLESEGYAIETVGVSEDGLVDPARVASAIKPETALCSIMQVNNEIGTIQPIQEIAQRVKRKNPQTVLHVDAVQSFGKIPLRFASLGVDLLSISGHKFHGGKGVGALVVRRGLRLRPLWGGGGQQKGIRPGTENVAGVAAMAAAAEVANRELPQASARMASLRDRLIHKVRDKVPNALLIGHATQRAPHNANLGFPGVRAEVLLHELERRGVIVSAGAACASRDKGPSHVLRAIGLPEDVGTIRVTLSRETSEADIDTAADAIILALAAIRL